MSINYKGTNIEKLMYGGKPDGDPAKKKALDDWIAKKPPLSQAYKDWEAERQRKYYEVVDSGGQMYLYYEWLNSHPSPPAYDDMEAFYKWEETYNILYREWENSKSQPVEITEAYKWDPNKNQYVLVFQIADVKLSITYVLNKYIEYTSPLDIRIVGYVMLEVISKNERLEPIHILTTLNSPRYDPTEVPSPTSYENTVEGTKRYYDPITKSFDILPNESKKYININFYAANIPENFPTEDTYLFNACFGGTPKQIKVSYKDKILYIPFSRPDINSLSTFTNYDTDSGRSVDAPIIFTGDHTPIIPPYDYTTEMKPSFEVKFHYQKPHPYYSGRFIANNFKPDNGIVLFERNGEDQQSSIRLKASNGYGYEPEEITAYSETEFIGPDITGDSAKISVQYYLNDEYKFSYLTVTKDNPDISQIFPLDPIPSGDTDYKRRTIRIKEWKVYNGSQLNFKVESSPLLYPDEKIHIKVRVDDWYAGGYGYWLEFDLTSDSPYYTALNQITGKGGTYLSKWTITWYDGKQDYYEMLPQPSDYDDGVVILSHEKERPRKVYNVKGNINISYIRNTDNTWNMKYKAAITDWGGMLEDWQDLFSFYCIPNDSATNYEYALDVMNDWVKEWSVPLGSYTGSNPQGKVRIDAYEYLGYGVDDKFLSSQTFSKSSNFTFNISAPSVPK